MAGFFGSARSRYANAVARQKGLYGNSMMSNARAKNAARAQQKEATRALWSARKRHVMDLLGKAKNGAADVTRKVGSGLATGGLAVVGAAALAAGAAAQAASFVGGKAYGAAGVAAAAAARAAALAAKKVRSYSVGRRVKNYFRGKVVMTNAERAALRGQGFSNLNKTNARNALQKLRNGFTNRFGAERTRLERDGGALAKMKAAAIKVREYTKKSINATKEALGKAGAAFTKGASNFGSFLGKKAGNARNYASRKVGNLRQGLSNMYTRMRYGGHEARLDAERQRAANAVNATKAALNRNSSAKAKAAGKTLGKIAAKLKNADVAAANGSTAVAATAIGAAATAAKTASRKGWFSKLGNAARRFTNGVGARLGKLRNMFKVTKKNNGSKNNGPKNNGPKPPQNAYGLPLKAAEGRSARKLMNEGAKPLAFRLPAPMTKSAAARRFAPTRRAALDEAEGLAAKVGYELLKGPEALNPYTRSQVTTHMNSLLRGIKENKQKIEDD